MSFLKKNIYVLIVWGCWTFTFAFWSFCLTFVGEIRVEDGCYQGKPMYLSGRISNILPVGQKK